MNLKEYLKREERSVKWLARKIECHYQTLNNIIKGKCLARPSLVDKIHKFTNGEVTIEPPPNKICPHCLQPLKRRLRSLPKQKIEVKKDVVDN